MKRFEEAKYAFEQLRKLDNSPSTLSLYEKVESEFIAFYYQPLSQQHVVQVKWIDNKRGKGVFAKKRFELLEVVLEETPLLSHRFIQVHFPFPFLLLTILLILFAFRLFL